MSFIGRFESNFEKLKKRNPANHLSHKFGFCFIEGGGFMTIGGIDDTVIEEPYCFTPFSSLDRYYRVNMKTVTIGKQRGYLDIKKWNQYISYINIH